MIKKLFLVALVHFSIFSFSQNDFIWVSDFDKAYSSVTVGDVSESLLYLICKSDKGSNIVIIKKNSGDTLKTIKFTGDRDLILHQVKCNNKGDAYVLGFFRKNLNVGSYSYDSEKYEHHTFIMKINSNEEIKESDVLMLKSIKGSHFDFTDDGGIVIGGVFRQRAEVFGNKLEGLLDDIFLLKLSNKFEFQWVSSTKGVGDNKLTAIYMDNNGDIVVAGSFYRSIIINETTNELTKGVYRGAVAWKIDKNNKLKWVRTFDPNKYGEISLDGVICIENRILFANSFVKEWSLNGDTIKSLGKKDILLFSMNSEGKDLKKEFHLKSPLDINIKDLKHSNGNIYMCGGFFKRLIIGDKTIYSKGDTNSFRMFSDIFLLGVDSKNEVLKIASYGSEKIDEGLSIFIDDKTIFMGGRFGGDITFGNFSFKSKEYQPKGFVAAIKNSTAGNHEKPCKMPPIAVMEKPADVGYNGFTLKWKAVQTAEYYHVKISPNKQFKKDSVVEFNNINSSENPHKIFSSLQSGRKYYYKVSVENNCGKISESDIKSLALPCKIDTLFFESNDQTHILFYIIDCYDNIIKMGCLKNDSLGPDSGPGPGPGPVIIDPPENTKPGKKKKPPKPIITAYPPDGPIVYGPEPDSINENPNSKRPEGSSIPLNVKTRKDGKIKDTTVYVNPENANTQEDSKDESGNPCLRLSDKEAVICLAKQGTEKLEALNAEIEIIMNKLKEPKKDDKKSKEELQKLALLAMQEIEEINDKIKALRKEYANAINTIAQKKSIKVEVKNNGAGFTISAGTITKARWSKYDSSPKLTVEFNISNFQKKQHKENKFSCQTTGSIQMDFVDNQGKMPYGAYRLLLGPCMQVKGKLSTTLAIIDQFENLKLLEFSEPRMTNVSCDQWDKCKKQSEKSKKNIKNYKFNRKDAYLEAFKAGLEEFAGTTTEGFSILFCLAVSVNMKDWVGTGVGSADLISWAGNKLADPYFEFFHERSETLDFLKKHRENVGLGTAFFNSYNNYKVFLGKQQLSKKNMEHFSNAMSNLQSLKGYLEAAN